MWRSSKTRSGFALFEVLIGVTIFAVGVLALGYSVENCLNASVLTEQEDRVRQILANRMAEIQATPGAPEESAKTESGDRLWRRQSRAENSAGGVEDRNETDLPGISLVTLTAQWTRGGVPQTRRLEFYVYRAS